MFLHGYNVVKKRKRCRSLSENGYGRTRRCAMLVNTLIVAGFAAVFAAKVRYYEKFSQKR